jgi:serine/threonine protein kinase
MSRAVEGNLGVYQINGAVAVRWAAPEVLIEEEPTAASDVYSLGVTMWECFSRAKLPYADFQTHSGVTSQVLQGKRPPRPARVTNTAVWNLIQSTWAVAPSARPLAGEIAMQLEAILNPRRSESPYGKTPSSVGEAHYSGIPSSSDVSGIYGGVADVVAAVDSASGNYGGVAGVAAAVRATHSLPIFGDSHSAGTAGATPDSALSLRVSDSHGIDASHFPGVAEGPSSHFVTIPEECFVALPPSGVSRSTLNADFSSDSSISLCTWSSSSFSASSSYHSMSTLGGECPSD